MHESHYFHTPIWDVGVFVNTDKQKSVLTISASCQDTGVRRKAFFQVCGHRLAHTKEKCLL